jgi:hypothetical protein
MRLRHLALLLAPLTAFLLDCATLDKLSADACGNGVVDAFEDCDSFPNDPKARCGAPSAGASQCRLLCGMQANGEVPECPDGWGCSVSGFCRQPTGAFESAGEPVSAGVTTMLVGDFDGDGRKDVVGSSGATSKGRIHYFKDGAAPQVVALPGVLASPLVFDFDQDGRSDIAFGYTFRGATEISDGILELNAAGGFAIMLGQADRAVVTKLFPTFTAPSFDAYIVPLAAKPNDLPITTLGNPVMSLVTVQNKEGVQATILRSLDGDPTDLTTGYTKLLPAAVGDLAGLPTSARIFDGLGIRSTCGEIVVPLKTASGARILFYSPCEKPTPGALVKAQWSKAEPKELTIPGETLTRVFAADVDGDKHVDLIVGTTRADGKPKVRVAYGDGTNLVLTDAPGDLTEVPLAAGFIDSDPNIDFVTPAGVLLSSKATKDAGVSVGSDGGLEGGAPLPPTDRALLAWNNIPAPTKRWTVAQIADVNRDLVPDVIGGSEYEPDIDVLEGTRTLAMPPFTIPTTGSVTNLVVGDFDFDLTDDIAFVQARPASTEREVAIAYGRALTMPPESPKPAGRLDGIRQVFVTPTGVTITSTTKGAAGGLPTFSLAVLLASGERQPVAPLLFDSEDGPGPPVSTRRELTTRALVASPAAGSAVDLIALVATSEYAKSNGKRTGDPSYAVWVAPGTGAAAFSAPNEEIPLPELPAVDRATDQFLVQMVSGDLDGDKKTEIVTVSPDDQGKGASLRVIRAGPQAALPTSVPIPGRSASGGTRAQLVDVDADGNVDLVTILRDNGSKVLAVNVLFGDGKGSLATATTVVALPLPAGANADDYAALGFAQITTGGGPVGAAGGKRRELAIVTPKHVFRAFVKADRTVEVNEATSIFGRLEYGSSVVAGDFDGDGVEDLAIADQGSIRIARQKARLP